MSRINITHRAEGHRVEGPGNRDLEQKLTYQQLLNLNHDLTKENQQLKNIGTSTRTQATASDRNCATCTTSSTSDPGRRTLSSTTPSAATQCFTNTNLP